MRYDRDGDQHYDVAQRFIKSIRGSDVDAALHYLARMVEAGEDPRFIARRLVISASEDIGLADPQRAADRRGGGRRRCPFIGLPEAQISLAQAVIPLATAPKSNAAFLAIDAALEDVRAGLAGPVPPHLRDAHYQGAKLGHGQGYLYPHDLPNAVAAQQYAPDAVQEAVLQPDPHGVESRYSDVYDRVRAMLGGRRHRSNAPGAVGPDGLLTRRRRNRRRSPVPDTFQAAR